MCFMGEQTSPMFYALFQFIVNGATAWIQIMIYFECNTRVHKSDLFLRDDQTQDFEILSLP